MNLSSFGLVKQINQKRHKAILAISSHISPFRSYHCIGNGTAISEIKLGYCLKK